MRPKKITDLLKEQNFEKSLLLGYYGGGNYGDELLLEVLANLLKKQGVEQATIGHHDPDHYHDYHREFGYPRISLGSKVQLLKALFTHKSVVVGGGGLWGVDMNFNTFLMSIFLFGARRILGKRVYLLGVGYYSSTTRMGRLGAWFAAKAANAIVARDEETYRNFDKMNQHTYLDQDMAWYINHIDLTPYQTDVAQLEQKLTVSDKTVVITLRRGQAKHQQGAFLGFNQTIAEFLEANKQRPIIVALLEAKDRVPDEYELAYRWREQYPNVQVLDTVCNPLTIFLFFQKYREQLALIGPQFHIIITAHLTGVPFLPLVYDNKVDALLDHIGIPASDRVSINDVRATDLQLLADNFFGN